MKSLSFALACSAIVFAQGSSLLAQEPITPAPDSMALLEGLQAGTLGAGAGTTAAAVAVALPMVGLVVLAATSDDDDSSG